ncbi:hypothetical protein RDWZM_007197 [Blomia tropicalis]|uniref:PX domain-containing protein n=1 Tax=Blomia tropicalis TaxID=40697 RepID=A0A9Q0M8Z8_BLOTA|nr:Phosphatidylinositol binding [Blomia tropicalis]KAJ6221385.1 hypothetical protein RDWZM_007197 [Blomia tropicalis]
MNGTSNRSTTTRKNNLLSTYLVSDDDEEDDIVDELKVCSQTKRIGNDDGDQSGRIELVTTCTTSRLLEYDHQISSVEKNCDELPSTIIDESPKPQINLWSDDTIETTKPRRSQYRITFEIIKAKTITSIENGTSGRNRLERRRYVSYTVLIKRVPGLETKPAIIERRYSDFLTFYNSIKKRYPILLRNVPFPKKLLIGNFSPEVIAERSLAFQQFLAYCLSISEIRISKEFATFLYYQELNDAKRCLQSIHLEEAAAIFENVYFIQDKLAIHSGRPNAQFIHTLCCLIGCLNAVDNTVEARKLADRTFEILFANAVVINDFAQNPNSSVYEVSNLYESSELVLPLIQLSLRLRWFTGPQRMSLENKLEELCRKQNLPRNYDSQSTLLEIILRKDFSPILDR